MEVLRYVVGHGFFPFFGLSPLSRTSRTVSLKARPSSLPTSARRSNNSSGIRTLTIRVEPRFPLRELALKSFPTD